MDNIQKKICEGLADICLSLSKHTKEKKHKEEFKKKAKIFKKLSKLIK